MKKIIIYLFLVSCFGCSNKVIAHKPGTPIEEFRKDNYECMQQSRTYGGGGGSGLIGLAVMFGSMASSQEQAKSIFSRCMEARGYTIEEVSPEELEKRKATGQARQ